MIEVLFLLQKGKIFNSKIINQNVIKILLLINFLSNICSVPNQFALFLIIQCSSANSIIPVFIIYIMFKIFVAIY